MKGLYFQNHRVKPQVGLNGLLLRKPNIEEKMEKAEMIYIASKYAEKGYGYADLYYGDDLYGKEHLANEIWEFVEEFKEIGRAAFREKYKEYKLY